MLRAVGVPVPEGRPVADADDAWAAALEVGLPVVIKPCDADHGDGITLNLNTREQLDAAYAVAVEVSPNIMVERYAPGAHHRMLVAGDRVIAAARRDAAQVIGDGVHSVAELVERTNSDPRRGDDDSPCCASSSSMQPLWGFSPIKAFNLTRFRLPGPRCSSGGTRTFGMAETTSM